MEINDQGFAQVKHMAAPPLQTFHLLSTCMIIFKKPSHAY